MGKMNSRNTSTKSSLIKLLFSPTSDLLWLSHQFLKLRSLNSMYMYPRLLSRDATCFRKPGLRLMVHPLTMMTKPKDSKMMISDAMPTRMLNHTKEESCQSTAISLESETNKTKNAEYIQEDAQESNPPTSHFLKLVMTSTGRESKEQVKPENTMPTTSFANDKKSDHYYS